MQTKLVFPLWFVLANEPAEPMREVITTTDAEGIVTTEVLDFTYDASGSPYTLTYTNGTASPVTYYYVVNLQGDVMRLVSASGATVAEYAYDPYGRVISATGEIAEVNPLRYRGYYYDAETEFYYLQSRYYDPTICRFINADAYASTGQGFLGQNMFAYCQNNPISYADPTGEIGFLWWLSLIAMGAIVTAGLSGCSQQPTSDVGSAPNYEDIKKYAGNDLQEQNCLGFAVRADGNLQPGDWGGKLYQFGDIDSFADTIEADLLAKGYTVRDVTDLGGANAKVYENEWKIAMRVGTKPYGCDYWGLPLYDYHFMIQVSTGQWAEKHGSLGASILHPLGETPDTISWDLPGRSIVLVGYYDSDIIYFAISKEGF